MKTIKLLALFYSSVVVIVLITTGVVKSDYQTLGPSLLLLPVAFYYLLALVNQLTGLLDYVRVKTVFQVQRAAAIYSFVIIVSLIIANIAASQNVYQATLTLFFFPLLLPFILSILDQEFLVKLRLQNVVNLIKASKNVLPLKSTPKSTPESTPQNETALAPAPPIEVLEGSVEEDDEDLVGVTDAKKRQFLKILGGGGVTLFLMLFLMPQQANAAFFGSVPGPGVVGLKDSSGDKIDPAEKQPTDGYTISEIDESTPSYFGFVHQSGAWYIAREDSSGSYRYTAGSSSFSTNWTNRASLSYDYFDTIF